MDNKVIGNKAKDNKDPKNKQKAMSGQSQAGNISGNQKPLQLRTQNSKEYTPSNEASENQGDSKTKVNAKRSKKLNRVGASYNDKSIGAAMAARGMHAPA